MVKVFWLEPLDRERRWLWRYRGGDHKCKATGHYCNAMVPFDEIDAGYEIMKDGHRVLSNEVLDNGKLADDDPRWPTKCEACGEPFNPEDEHQMFCRSLYVRHDTGEIMTTEDAPPGACWNAWWMADRDTGGKTGVGWCLGDDHRCLVVKCPDGHDWMVDARASNCTMPDDAEHHCWVRHGKPEDGTLHVDKNGKTCAAGAGSIQTGNWHGFLHHGELHT